MAWIMAVAEVMRVLMEKIKAKWILKDAKE